MNFRQGFDPSQEFQNPLRALDLYCGLGNFGMGVEDGGAVKVVSAVDFAQIPIHTYMANLKQGDDCLCYWGSVDDFLKSGLKGRWDEVPAPGSIDAIIAGCPCQGFL